VDAYPATTATKLYALVIKERAAITTAKTSTFASGGHDEKIGQSSCCLAGALKRWQGTR
jgi:hypothetical protein